MNFNRWLDFLNGYVLKAFEEGGSFWMPPQASNFAYSVDWIFYYIYWISVFFFLLIVGWMVLFVVMFREREGHKEEKTATHNTPIELTWTIIPLLIVITIFYFGFKGFVDKMVVPNNSYTIKVYGQKWQWFFEYPNGYQDQDLHVPMGVPVELVITSSDVTHSLYIPAFRVKMDAVPGRFTKLWFQADEVGEYMVYCAEYCGTSHSDMLALAVVHPRGEFEKWLVEASNFLDKDPPAVAGEKLYNKKGCKQCHSIDGTASTGPTFADIWGKEEPMQDGSSVLVDENYIRESILDPQIKIRQGFEGVMPTYQGKITDHEILALISFIKKVNGLEVSEVPIPQQFEQENGDDSEETTTGQSIDNLEESQSEESQSEESQSDESQSDESQPVESQSDESQPVESQSDESQSDESQSDESQPDESQPVESQPDESLDSESDDQNENNY